MKKGAIFSDDRIYRYNLFREREEGKGIINFLLLNPSTADENVNDPTVERCQRRAFVLEGFRTMVVTNIFAYRSTDPAGLLETPFPVGPENDFYILREALASSVVVCAGGNHGRLSGRGRYVATMLRDAGVSLFALRLSKTGQPCHPLYLPYEERIKPWKI